MLVDYRDVIINPLNAPAIVASRVFDISGVIRQSDIDALPAFRNGDTLRLTGNASFAPDTCLPQYSMSIPMVTR
jgi:hypothetical protein